MSEAAPQARGRNPLPEGTIPIGLGLLISGVCLYGVITIATRGLGKELYAPFAVFWPVLFVCGPGFFLPLEQEVTRALAARRVGGVGGGPLVGRAALAGGVVVVLLVATALLFSGVIVNRLFDGSTLLLASLMAGFVAYYAEHLARGMLSGNGRFRAYGILMASEGLFRVGICIALALSGIQNPGAYAAAMVIGSLIAVLIALRGQHNLVTPGPEAPWSEMSTALGFLLATSVLNQLLLNIGPIAVKILATREQQAQTGPFLNGLIISRVPLFLFQAVQAALLPKLAGLVSAGRYTHLRRSIMRLLVLVAILAVLATGGAFVMGPWVITLLFGSEFALGHDDLGMLAAASSGFMAAIVLTQALIALHGYWRALAGWIAASFGFAILLFIGNDLFGRVERGLLGAAVTAIVVMGGLLIPLVRHDDTVATEDYTEAVSHVVGEV